MTTGKGNVPPPLFGRAILSAAEFARLAELAWRVESRTGLARQISAATNRPEDQCELWLSDDTRPAPADIIKEGVQLANKRSHENADFLVGVGLILALKAGPQPDRRLRR